MARLPTSTDRVYRAAMDAADPAAVFAYGNTARQFWIGYIGRPTAALTGSAAEAAWLAGVERRLRGDKLTLPPSFASLTPKEPS